MEHYEENLDYDSDEDVNHKEHSRLVDAISKLDKTQHIKKPTRSEPTLQSSEFHLVKSGSNRDNAVLVTDLVKVLGKTAKHAEIGKKLRTTQKKTKTLQKPLEKPQAERIQRAVGFDNVKKQLGRWDAIVSKNRVAAHQSFPLHQANVSMKPSTVFLSKFRIKSDLEKELDAVKKPPEESENEDTEEFPLTLEEIIERRKEAAKLRAQQTYREAKARRQNKIKSKKFHRILRREKIKQKLKDFEVLQKNDPEAALQQLDELEKTRAGERASLKHRSTGKWAQNLQIRAKYDRESRAELAQQLAISRELTQKVDLHDSSDSEQGDDDQIQQDQDKDNPWTQPQKTKNEIDDFVSGYRKYWDEQNKETITKEKKSIESTVTSSNVQEVPNSNGDTKLQKGVTIDNVETFFINTDDMKINNKKNQKRVNKTVKKQISSVIQNYNTTPSKNMNDISDIDLNSTILSIDQNLIETSLCTSSWLVTDIDLTQNKNSKAKNKKIIRPIDEMFDDVEDKVQAMVQKRLEKLKKNVNAKDSSKEMGIVDSDEEYIPDLSFKNQRKRPDVDIGMNETVANHRDPSADNLAQLKALSSASITQKQDKNVDEGIDPNKFINMKPKHLLTALPDMVTADEALDDNDEKENKQMIIAEAFEDDDIVTDFQKEKNDIVNKDKPEDIDLCLPGWGSWGGANIKNTRKRKRFTIKFPKKLPRKDENKGDLIVNENPNSKLKTHMVSELPFPFTSVSDFEASVRAPIGTTFIPVNASKKLTQPAVTTKLGAIIEPMDEDMLVKKKGSKLKMRS